MILRYLIVLALLWGLNLRSSAQLSFGGIPASFSQQKKSSVVLPFIDMKSVDNNELLKDEKTDPNNLKTFRFAKGFDVNISPENSGVWEVIDNMKVWRVGLRSKGAWSLNLIFDRMIIPQDASLFIYTPNHSKVLGAFTSDSEQSTGYFSTYPIAGDEIIVEYNEPTSSTYPGELHIATVNHDYKNAFGTRPLGESGLCNMDVFCPDASKYQTTKQSVLFLIINGSELCTGTLINNTKQDKTPYLLTAGHCIENASDAKKTVFCFNYESPGCGNGESSLDGYVDQSLSGAILKARSDSLDFTLVQLETAPPAKYRPYYAGWNRTAVIPTSTAAIHHPNGDVKKISKDNNPPTIGSYNSDFKSNSFWIIGNWEIGTTQAGSSGGPLFNQNKLLIGTLTGGEATCLEPANDLFCMLNKQWDTNKSAAYQLKYWLDPTNTGVTELPGLSPFGSDSCMQFTNIAIDEQDTLMKYSNQYGGYKTGHNIMKTTSYAERFTKTSKTLLSSVSIGVARLSSATANINSKIILKVYNEVATTGLPGDELASMDVPLNLMSSRKMNFIELTNPIVLNNHYFIGFDINYTNAKDTFAVYCTPDRIQATKNSSYAKSGNIWKPFFGIPGFGISTSMLISANCCENTMSTDTVIPTPETPKYAVIYQQSGVILYQQTGLGNYLLLQNTGTEKTGTIALYDILGRKLYEDKRVISNTPGEISSGQLPTGLYFLTIEDGISRQVIKFKVNYPL
jgi:lysyl endopeptidase